MIVQYLLQIRNILERILEQQRAQNCKLSQLHEDINSLKKKEANNETQVTQ